MKGARPKSTALKLLSGNPGGRPLNWSEPRPELCIPEPPSELVGNARAKAEWDFISKQLYDLGLLSGIDKAALAAYCLCYSRWLAAEDHIKENGLVLKDGHGGFKKNPAASIASSALREMRAFIIEFGMSPSSRTRLKANPPKTDTEEECIDREFFNERAITA